MTIAVPIVLAGVLILAGVLWWSSPGKIRPIADASGAPVPGSISEKTWLEINGVRQGMFIQSRDPANPVLLILHGGPGMPEYYLTEQFPTGLENDFTVVWWDQRGAGLSYSPSIPAQSMTVEQYIADVVTVTNHLRERFQQDRIYLMAHSGGSFFGIQAAQRAPELYYAYIGVGQLVHQLESERLAHDYMLAEYASRGDTRMVRKLEAAAPGMTMPLPPAYDRLRDNAMHGIGVGTTRDMKTIEGGVFFPSWLTRQLTLGEKLNLWRGKVFCAGALRSEVFSTDLRTRVTTLDLPVYFFSGRYDYTVNHDLSRAYLDSIQAPVKRFYTFENSAHSPFFEEPEAVRRILRDEIVKR